MIPGATEDRPNLDSGREGGRIVISARATFIFYTCLPKSLSIPVLCRNDGETIVGYSVELGELATAGRIRKISLANLN